MDRKKELKEMYKQMKTDMGAFIIRLKTGNKYYLETTHNLNGKINSSKFQLKMGSFRNEQLQKEWKQCGADNFEIKILEKLKYDEDESKTDYSEELEIMKTIWEEKLSEQNMVPYR
ncbi:MULTISPECIES: GIY-YIG nuclease family protein [unclassified Sedimentibacter]|uniref:GIY-YIG nuclease family protein n=1 Tax=unclassified Sedimentibacter TaxID=2649220 RepID=UPI0027DFBF7D|nr:GIY-YIG nuclease family protein [Sedimentibacter sp. MB35-C1]WMJ78219.1 GIY-YIG nuclease family protein [Sedimentibacter sp. MB35-C1]